MKKFKCSLLGASCVWVVAFSSLSILAQDYPYDDPSQAIAEQNAASSLPTEGPQDPSSRASARNPVTKANSLFRMGVKAGSNFTSFQDGACIAATNLGCTTYQEGSYSGMGFDVRVSFGWDLAYQPIFLETEFGYQQKLMNLDTGFKVVQVQQGLYHRHRSGKKSLWKNGLLMALDTRIAESANKDLDFSIFPAFGISSVMEWGSFMVQLNVYLSQFRSKRIHWSSSTLVGLRF